MRGYLRSLLVLAAFSCSQATADNTRPNILLIIADDLGYTDMGSFGGEIATPTLDALAYGGVRFTNFHMASACQQTRSMLMSGRGFTQVIQRMPPRPGGERAHQLRTDVATLPEFLRAAGYATYISGKWDLGLTPETMPVARGFNRSFTLLEASSSHFAEYFWAEKSYYQEDDRHVPLDELPPDFYSTRTYTDKILEYIGEHDGEAPWFSMVTYTAPHWPLQVPDDWLDRYSGRYDEGYDALRAERVARAKERGVLPRGSSLSAFEPTAAPWSTLTPELQRRYARSQELYASMTEYLDEQIGRIVDHLMATGQFDNTVILFMSDHGASGAEIGIMDGPTSMPPHFNVIEEARDNSYENFGRTNSFIDHGRGFAEAATAPLRFFKGTLGEGALRGAAFIHYPEEFAEPAINNTFITVMDILPTFLDIAAAGSLDDFDLAGRDIQPIAGRSFWAHLTGEEETVHGDDSVAGWSREPYGALVKGRFKLVNQLPPGVPVPDSSPPWQLFDLAVDPGETTDIVSEHPELAAELEEIWRRDWQ
ncbi:MAG: sulfatase-like hydrolase/transferase [Woeseiaceae bacterium]